MHIKTTFSSPRIKSWSPPSCPSHVIVSSFVITYKPSIDVSKASEWQVKMIPWLRLVASFGITSFGPILSVLSPESYVIVL